MKKLKYILQSKYLFKVLCLISIMYSLSYMNYFYPKSKYSKQDKEIIGQVIQYQIDGNKVKININGKEKIIVYYYFKTKQEKEEYIKNTNLGDKIKITGQIKVPVTNTIPNGFNYKKYLKNQKINYYMNATKIKKLENNTSILYHIKNKLIKRIDKIDNSGYFRTFILGDKTLIEEEIKGTYQTNGISHLFSISGMHINLIVSTMMFILNKISYSNLYKNSIIIPILLIYLFLTGGSASILRTVLMFCVFAINKSFNLKIKRLDLMLIVLIIAILIKPLIIYDIGFQFSYIISFTLVIFNKRISKFKKKWQQGFYSSIVCFLISLPICIYYYYEVNILSILLNFIMIPFVSIIIFPMTIITLIIPIIYPIYEVLVNILEKINIFISSIKIFNLILAKPSIILITIYYLIIYLSIFKSKYLFLFIILVILHKNYLFFDKRFFITILDVGQGDCIFIKMPDNQGNILIDTGGKVELPKEEWKKSQKDNSLSKKNIIPYLKSTGITKLEYLVISHGDYDHMGEAINLVNNFKVEKIIFNCGEFNELEQDLIKVLDKKKIPYYSCIKELNIDDNKLYFLNNKDYGNENDNSSVIYTELNNHKFLFMGDVGVEVEEDLIQKYNLKDIDVLKVGHHGSKTSSSQSFIDEINPKYSIISVGKNNRYGHPNKEVINNLDNSKIYRTDENGSIMFKIKNNKLQIETCTP